METAEKLITANLDVWTSAVKTKSSTGRGSSKKRELHGIQKLRELILDLAISGNLLPQEDDEVVDQNSIAEAKKEVIKERRIRRQPKAPDNLEELFPLPRNWVAYSLGELVWNCKSSYGSNPDPGLNTKGVVKVGNISNFSYFTGEFSPRGFEEGELEDLLCEEGDLLVVKSSGSAENVHSGKITLCERQHHHQIVATNFVMRFRLFSDEILPRYAWYFLKSRHVRAWVKRSVQTMTYPNLKWTTYSEAFVGVPPLPEQHRIVAKVDELMALCDQLEQEQESSLDTHDTLVATLLGALTTATADASQFAEAWQRIQANFDTLFTTESSIAQLKQTILQLAVMGKLVPQDDEDEAASELLRKIVAEKAKLAKAGLIKKQKAPSSITEEEIPYSLPNGWQWCRLGATGICATGKTPKTGKQSSFGGEIEFIGPGQITPTGKLLASDKTLTEEGVEESTEALPGDILMVCIGGSIGKSVIADRRVAFNQQINVVRPIDMPSSYLNSAISTDRFFGSVLEKASGSATPIINRSKWESLLVPIPPAEEQKAIVKRVEELMALCDQLKTSLATAQATQLNLADSLVEQAIG